LFVDYVEGTGSGSCQLEGFGNSVVESSGFRTSGCRTLCTCTSVHRGCLW